jgi:hypothetical protein
MKPNYENLGKSIGHLVASKQKQYGNSVKRAANIFNILYPEGIQPYQYQDVLLVVRILDKLSRIAERGPDLDSGGESPYKDIAGYGLLGQAKDEKTRWENTGYSEPEKSPLLSEYPVTPREQSTESSATHNGNQVSQCTIYPGSPDSLPKKT